ncbi:MAG TPA: DUF3303 family protein [Burkholderiales bacterium]|nr:DUF3303 family protein [Burkholderiales bacterium]
MLFMVVSTPRPERPSTMTDLRQSFWAWIEPHLASGLAKWTYARCGRGAVALFDVESHETLHRLLNEWAEIIPATFEVHPLMEVAQSRKFLDEQAKTAASERRSMS